ncbi:MULTISPECIES: alpha/beta fold hydrolase [unclassified Paenibacillus]|uniref:alpha/beta fold hydrolase n=1 Tax=unclassified Paenibacillus TaxID=185978 RepID=UPI00115FF782|nr:MULTISPECIES: alpha/beta hydrolase [unclassified Paenibacillus]
MSVAQLNGASLYYETYGSGAAIIFVHGHGWTHRMFAPQLDYFSERYQVIVCDLRGNGRSEKLRQSPERVIDVQCLDLILLMNTLGIRQAVFVGISHGGLIVQQMAVQYPERVMAMVIADSFCRSGTATITGKLQVAAAHLSWLSGYAPAELMLPSLRLMYSRWDLAYRELRRNMRDRRPRELYRQRLATSRIDYSEQLAAVRQPALCVVGDYSEYAVHCMKEVAAYLPHAELMLIPDACDPSNLCQPELFNAIVQRFLDEQLERRPSNLPRGERLGE